MPPSTVEADFARLRHRIANGHTIICDRCHGKPTYGMTVHLKCIPGSVMVICAACARSTDDFGVTGVFGIERSRVWR